MPKNRMIAGVNSRCEGSRQSAEPLQQLDRWLGEDARGRG
jgi:hypothetical protein